MQQLSSYNRRLFLVQSASACAALGIGAIVGKSLFADKAELEAQIAATPESHPLVPALKLGSDAMTALESVTDYKCTFIKKEMLGRKLLDSQAELKFRDNPFSVYMKFQQPSAGREVLFVAGQNDNKLLVRESGFAALAGTLALEPTANAVMKENRYPVTSLGMKNMVAKVLEQWLADSKIDGITVNYYPNAKIGQTACKAIETLHRQQTPQTKFHTTRLYVEAETGYPIRLQQYDFPSGRRQTEPQLVEDYLYSNLVVNTGLTDVDFSKENPQYNLR